MEDGGRDGGGIVCLISCLKSKHSAKLVGTPTQFACDLA